MVRVLNLETFKNTQTHTHRERGDVLSLHFPFKEGNQGRNWIGFFMDFKRQF
jgi:hypothetical protein